MAKSAAGKSANVFVWILLGLLFVALAGFGTGQFGGSVNSIGRVGDRDLDVNDYARGLDQELRAFSAQTGQNMTLSQAEAFGVTRQVLSQLVLGAALDNEAAEAGISVGDQRVRDEVLQIPGFQGLDGSFDRTAYEQSLRQSGLTVRAYEDRVRDDVARTLLQAAVVGGVRAPETASSRIFDFVSARRSTSWITLTSADLDAPLPEPSDADLRSFHSDNADRFRVPETRRITYAWLTPELMLSSIDVDDAELRQLYENRDSEFNLPERRLVERLVLRDTAAAEATLARITNGEITFDTLVAERGLTLSDIDLGDVREEDLEDAGAVVFGLAEPGIVGPVPTPLGPALFRVNAILAAQVTPFEEAREALLAEAATDRARRIIADMAGEVDDLLAGGATLEEITAETELDLGQIDFRPDSDADIAGYADFRRVAATVTADDFPEIASLDDGGIFALRLDEIAPERPQTFDEARDAVITTWEANATTEALSAQADALLAEVRGGEVLSEFSRDVRQAQAITRQSFVEGLPPTALEALFEMTMGDARVFPGEGQVSVVRLDAILAPDPTDPSAVQIRQQINDQLSRGVAQDVFALFGSAVQTSAGISLNQTAINAVHAQFP